MITKQALLIEASKQSSLLRSSEKVILAVLTLKAGKHYQFCINATDLLLKAMINEAGILNNEQPYPKREKQ